MKNITLSVDEKELEEGREYAREHGISLNELIRQLLRRTVRKSSSEWLDDCFKLMDRAKVKKPAEKWKRDDLYDV